jgi:hypothetical protein
MPSRCLVADPAHDTANAAGQTHTCQAIYGPLMGKKLQVWRDNSYTASGN